MGSISGSESANSHILWFQLRKLRSDMIKKKKTYLKYPFKCGLNKGFGFKFPEEGY